MEFAYFLLKPIKHNPVYVYPEVSFTGYLAGLTSSKHTQKGTGNEYN